MLIGGGGGGSIGGGGGGSVTVNTNVAVTPGTTYNLTVGAGGTYGIPGNNGVASTIAGPALTASASGGGGGAGDSTSAVISSGNTGGGSGFVAPNIATSGYTGGNGLVVGGTNSGGGGAGAGAGATTWYQVSNSNWGSFMNSYAIWSGGAQDVTTRTYTVNIYVPYADYYQFDMGVDNAGYLQLDGDTILSLEYGSTGWTYQSNPASSATAYMTAGMHQISMVVTNYGGPAGGAVRILDPNGDIFWTTRTYAEINSPNQNEPGDGGIGVSVVFSGVQYDVGGGGAGMSSYGSVLYSGTASFGGGATQQNATSWGGGGGGSSGPQTGNGYQGLIAINYHT
jgi:hypothetical protein